MIIRTWLKIEQLLEIIEKEKKKKKQIIIIEANLLYPASEDPQVLPRPA
ncbi:MAG: hypothetical protein PWQ51_1288 [Methanolobus sp.]|jgi:hypothetical protein|nr:hypothetical protein [Methanolobus sp.]MDK2939124.1 hypothetical protein [Methanolobus sp.]